jgi:hypothetical protein
MLAILLKYSNLGGRFALRNSLPRTEIISDPGQLFELMDNPKFELTLIEQLNRIALMVTYRIKDPYVVENHASNLPISIFTTAYARY